MATLTIPCRENSPHFDHDQVSESQQIFSSNYKVLIKGREQNLNRYQDTPPPSPETNRIQSKSPERNRDESSTESDSDDESDDESVKSLPGKIS